MGGKVWDGFGGLVVVVEEKKMVGVRVLFGLLGKHFFGFEDLVKLSLRINLRKQ